MCSCWWCGKQKKNYYNQLCYSCLNIIANKLAPDKVGQGMYDPIYKAYYQKLKQLVLHHNLTPSDNLLNVYMTTENKQTYSTSVSKTLELLRKQKRTDARKELTKNFKKEFKLARAVINGTDSASTSTNVRSINIRQPFNLSRSLAIEPEQN